MDIEPAFNHYLIVTHMSTYFLKTKGKCLLAMTQALKQAL